MSKKQKRIVNVSAKTEPPLYPRRNRTSRCCCCEDRVEWYPRGSRAIERSECSLQSARAKIPLRKMSTLRSAAPPNEHLAPHCELAPS